MTERVKGEKQTLAEEVSKSYLIAHHDRDKGQYHVTVPPRIAEAWIRSHGRKIRWQPTPEGLLMVPVVEASQESLPEWLRVRRED